MSTIPVAMSICVSFISAILILGAPAEMYMYGTQYWLTWIGLTIASVLAALLFVPLLYPLKLTSSYEVCVFVQIIYKLVRFCKLLNVSSLVIP